LILEQAVLGREVRRGLIEEVHSPDGAPPYWVRWLDTGHEALVFPGPDAHVQTAAEFAAGTQASQRVAEVQEEVAAPRRRT
jgi:hypothetical protein